MCPALSSIEPVDPAFQSPSIASVAIRNPQALATSDDLLTASRPYSAIQQIEHLRYQRMVHQRKVPRRTRIFLTNAARLAGTEVLGFRTLAGCRSVLDDRGARDFRFVKGNYSGG